MGDRLSCTTVESIEFVETYLLQILLETRKDHQGDCSYLMACFPELEAILVGLSQKLEAVDDFTIRGDVMPYVLARTWISQLAETQWCLAQVCQNAAVSMDAQETMEQFTTIARDSQTAKQLLKYSRIIYMSMKVVCRNHDDWRAFLSTRSLR